MSKWVKCPKCNGKGEIYDHFAGIMTLGLSYLYGDHDVCPRCNGKGFLRLE